MITVSIITTTFNRARFMPRLIEMYKSQTYPHEKMEWILLDDGDEPSNGLFKYSGLPNIHYLNLAKKLPMGSKLNILKAEAKGDIVIVMDDDDYYPPERVQTVVDAFEKNPDKRIAGCSKVYMYYTDTDEIYCTGPYHKNHALNCTIAWRKEYAKTHRYNDYEPCAVESAFLNGFTEPMIQLPTEKTILHIIHSSNTFNAIKGRNEGTIGLMSKTSLHLKDFIQDEKMIKAFYGIY